jgi:hypothetical protein
MSTHSVTRAEHISFNAIEQKVIDEAKLLDSERRHFDTLCLLEATFPP